MKPGCSRDKTVICAQQQFNSVFFFPPLFVVIPENQPFKEDFDGRLWEEQPQRPGQQPEKTLLPKPFFNSKLSFRLNYIFHQKVSVFCGIF